MPAIRPTPRAPVGEFVSMLDDYVNLGGRDMEGYELGVQYRLPPMRPGTFTLSAESTHYIRREDSNEDGGAPLDTLARNGRAKWRANGSLAWRKGAWSAAWFSTYYGTFVDTSAATTEAIYRALGAPDYIRVFNDNGVTRYLLRVDPVIVHNVSAGYRFGRGRVALAARREHAGRDQQPSRRGTSGGRRDQWFPGWHDQPARRQFTLEIAKKF